jgi:DNA polymerase-3 subunit epsilon
MTGYTVIDLETTGLFPQKHDRVVELAMVYVSEDGEVQDSWSTIVNPQRDVGPTHIHQITAREVLAAPTFADLAPYVVQGIAGRTVVAHNARFDLLFLDYEFSRAGMELAKPPVRALCTMEWSGRLLRTVSRRLSDCCSAAGVAAQDAHTAFGDAHATADLLRCLLAAAKPPAWHADIPETRAYGWPVSPQPWPTVALTPRSQVTHRRPDAWMDRIVSGMPRHSDAGVEAYLEILEAALLDRYLAEYEEQALAEMASMLGLAPESLRDLHRDYLKQLAVVALADGVVSAVERADLEQVACLLGLTPTDVEAALEAAAAESPTPSHVPVFRLVPGDQVCLTGQMSRPRAEIERDAEGRELVVGGLTKRTKLLVAADPDSQSGKAAKARDYGVPAVTESAFMRLLLEM